MEGGTLEGVRIDHGVGQSLKIDSSKCLPKLEKDTLTREDASE